MAITMYQRAIEALLKLVQLYPSFELNKVYVYRAMAYQERVKVLQGSWAGEEPEEGEEPISPITPRESKPQPAVPGEPEKPAPKKSSYDELVVREKPNVKWDEVIGLEESKRSIRESIIYPLQRPDLFPLGWPRGILLFGPPGCGKTLLAAAVATEIEATFFSVDAASIMSKWLGEAERNVARLFGSARRVVVRGEPAIIFIDEIDSILGVHTTEVGGEVRVRNQFLKEMDGIIDKSRLQPLYVIGVTNKPWALDWPFIRRFQKRVMVPLPDFKARVEMFKLYTKDLRMAPDVDLNELATSTNGYSGSDIRDVCQAAQLRVVGELFESGRALDKSSLPRLITVDDFQKIFEERRPSVSPEMSKTYQTWYDNFKAL
jgi:SpoVK/Ycf46/Vps4 family AAA+-type ATPase